MYLTKTTINLPTDLLYLAKQKALEDSTSVTQLVITGLKILVAGQTFTKPSLLEFVKQLPKQKKLTGAQKDQIYRQHLDQKYGTNIS